ncbi:MobC family plasmid mobilization relaxosome protein [Microvirga mediterraneensis]|uniref:Plasmid mobilization relaxosome protein MobC n=1 Tax=Microvirga mediterraneensis TaxID=2754695 RepID=A0A838BU59_9HYPH|nr:MobC family plasmid mobilization relaxosome protein [Microvirga mediterraneensis]MBA1159404.1 plasmid mobilization relaxosome protein MobC [Microvirga mediterraneensis]
MTTRSPRSNMVQVRASAEELARWQAKAKAAGMRLSGLVRQALDEARPARRRSRPLVDPALLRQLALIGNNLNQLARWANRDRGGVDAVAVVARLIEIDRELSAVRAAVEASHAD